MVGPEEAGRTKVLNEYGLTFLFEDGEDPDFVESTIYDLINERYEEVDQEGISFSELGGTTYIAFFDATDERALKSIFDANSDEIRKRLLTLDHIANKL